MGGLIFIIPTIASIVILLLWNKIEFSANLFIVMFVFLAYAFLGFIDDYLIIRRHNNEGLTVIQKLIGQIIIAVIFFVTLYLKTPSNLLWYSPAIQSVNLSNCFLIGENIFNKSC